MRRLLGQHHTQRCEYLRPNRTTATSIEAHFERIAITELAYGCLQNCVAEHAVVSHSSENKRPYILVPYPAVVLALRSSVNHLPSDVGSEVHCETVQVEGSL